MLRLLDRSIALDPGFARAHALRGTALDMQVQLGHSGPETLDEAEREAERALALDPQLGPAHMLLGALRASRAQWVDADASYRRAVALDPQEPQVCLMYAVYGLAPTGRQREAIEFAHHAYELAPAMVGAVMTLAGAYGLTGRDKEMTEYLRVVTDLGAPPQLPVPIFRSETARRAGRYAEAAELVMGVLPPEVRAPAGEEVVRLVFRAFGDRAVSVAAVPALRALYAKLDPRVAEGWPMAILTLEWFALLGAMDDAHQVARRIVTRLERSGRVVALNLPPLWLPELAAFRRDPRFQELAAGLGFIDFWKATRPPDGYALERGRLVERSGE